MSRQKMVQRSEVSLTTQVVCPRCRMVQVKTDRCRSCDQLSPAAFEADRTPYYKVQKELRSVRRTLSTPISWQFTWIALLLATLAEVGIFLSLSNLGAHIKAYPSIETLLGLLALVAPFAVIYGTGQLLPAIFSAKKLQGVAPPRALPSSRSTAYRGTARRLSSTTTRHLSEESCLAAYLVVGTFDKTIYFRSARTVPFLVTLDDGAQVVVRGESWVTPSLSPALCQRQPLKDALSRLGLPDELSLHRSLDQDALECVIQDGDRIEVRGVPRQGVVSELAQGYRGGEITTVLEGLAGAPVMVERLA